MSQNSNNLTQTPLSGLDLFLLERWDAESPLSPEEQVIQLFTRYVTLPVSKHQAYDQYVIDRGISYVADLSESEQAILAVAESAMHTPNDDAVLMFRMYYGGPAPGMVFVSVLHCLVGTSTETPVSPEDCEQLMATREPLLVRWHGRDGIAVRERYMAAQTIMDHALIVRSFVFADVPIWLDQVVAWDDDWGGSLTSEDDSDWESETGDDSDSDEDMSSDWDTDYDSGYDPGDESDGDGHIGSDPVTDNDSGYETGEDWGTEYDTSDEEEEDLVRVTAE